MRNSQFINEMEMRKAIQTLFGDGSVFEVRILRGKFPISGYFRDADKLIEKLDTVDLKGANVYVTLGTVDDSCFSRIQSECFRDRVQTTTDNNITRYRWFFVDLDPVRTSGISSSDTEKREAFRLAPKIITFLQGLGFEDPMLADSGNGIHLQYAIDIANNDTNQQLIEKCLKALDMLFSTDMVKVDTSNFNPSRICKLYGTMAQKGTSTSDRPHRMSRILKNEHPKKTSIVYLQKLAEQLPEKPEEPSKANNYSPKSFDVVEWMNRHGLRYEAKEGKDGIEKYVLDECPFNSEHRAPDSMIFRQANGAIGFKCLHNSCSCKTWKDVRLMFEPDAYDGSETDRRINEGWKQHNRDKIRAIQEREEKRLTTDHSRIFLTAEEINALPDIKPEYIRTGIMDIDRLCNGLGKGQVSVLSGLRASGKSTILGQIMLEAINDGHNVVCYSGELTKQRYMRWLYCQAAGKTETIQVGINDYEVKPETKKQIAAWMARHFFLYDNDYGNDVDQLLSELRIHIAANGTDLVILDNLMTLDLGEEEQYDKYRAQKKLMQSLVEIAHTYNVHICLVAHPRKSITFLRLEDISGTNDIVNMVDNAFIVHRVNNDFKRQYAEIFKLKKDADPPLFHASNVVEIAKDREHGVQDVFASLYFEPSTKRLRNSIEENRVYGWQPDGFEHGVTTPFDEDDR